MTVISIPGTNLTLAAMITVMYSSNSIVYLSFEDPLCGPISSQQLTQKIFKRIIHMNHISKDLVLHQTATDPHN